MDSLQSIPSVVESLSSDAGSTDGGQSTTSPVRRSSGGGSGSAAAALSADTSGTIYSEDFELGSHDSEASPVRFGAGRGEETGVDSTAITSLSSDGEGNGGSERYSDTFDSIDHSHSLSSVGLKLGGNVGSGIVSQASQEVEYSAEFEEEEPTSCHTLSADQIARVNVPASASGVGGVDSSGAYSDDFETEAEGSLVSASGSGASGGGRQCTAPVTIETLAAAIAAASKSRQEAAVAHQHRMRAHFDDVCTLSVSDLFVIVVAWLSCRQAQI